MKDKARKLRPPTEKELKELFQGIIQENHDHPPKPRQVICGRCNKRETSRLVCSVYPNGIPKEILTGKKICEELSQK